MTEMLSCVRRTVFSVRPLRAGAPSPVLRLLTSLAEGTDRIAAHAALHLGFEVQAPLPFLQEEYEKDFAVPGSVEEFRSLLAQASSVFRLNADPAARDLGYRAAGEVVATQCDLLLAVWDGQAAHGVGGTGDLVEHAQFLGLPILHIDSQAPSRLLFLDRNGKHADALAALEGSIRSLFLQSGHSSQQRSAEPRGVGESKGATAFAGRTSGLVRVIAIAKPPADTALGFAEDYIRAHWPGSAAQNANIARRTLIGDQVRRAHGQVPTHEAPEIQNESLRPYFLWTDRLAVHYGKLSRGASLRIQMWAALAVVSCLLTIPLDATPHAPRFLSCCELIFTLAVLIEAFVAWRFRWHDRWMVFRSVAEQIRCLDLLAPVALGIPRLHVFSAQDGAPGQGFAAYFVQSLARSIGLPSAEVNAAYLNKQTHHLLAAVERQRKFHDASSARYEKLERLLTRGGFAVFALTFVACVCGLCWAICTGHHTPWLTFCTALLLSVGATIAALAAQGEFKRLAKRSDSMRRALYLLHHRLRLVPPTSLRAATVAATEVSEILVTEVRDWEALLSARAPTVNI
jgi:hypothetical protein